jgi:hypothetical protein
MQARLRQWALIALGVFVVAVILSLATSGVVSDIGFFIYAAAFIVLVGLLIALLLDYLRARRGPPAGQP